MNIDEILAEKIVTKKDGSYDIDYIELKDAKQAIKEIVKDVIQLCADNAETKETFFGSEVDKQSILEIINEINF